MGGDVSVWGRRIAIPTLVIALLVLAWCSPRLLVRDWELVDQGRWWTDDRRYEFYSRDQGSRLMPLSWFMALKLPDDRPFTVDGLRRYGFLPNEQKQLPVGFSVATDRGEKKIGLTCAACHTRQIEFGGKAYRIDGGPAITDFQTLLSDLDTAVGTVLGDANAFEEFARAVLGNNHSKEDEAELRADLDYWYGRYHTLMDKALPPHPWGPGRMDAVGMIYNRLTGLDLGPGPDFIIKDNIKRAEAPVRYPFLWNVRNENWTQWPGFAPNDRSLFRLVRNVGQVLGVFAEFRPKKDGSWSFGVDFATGNSVNIGGLKRLEDLASYIRPPRWPQSWPPLDQALVGAGRDIYRKRKDANDKTCLDCHPDDLKTAPWETKILEVNTDSKELDLVPRQAESGELEGTKIFRVNDGKPLGKTDKAHAILAISAVGTVAQKYGDPFFFFTVLRDLEDYSVQTGVRGYEARALHGIWAAAPYLHNGSVPTLTELLKPSSDRIPSFKVGSAYDPATVGLAEEQTQFTYTMTTTDCNDSASGNSRCGHEYGTSLTDTEKRALLEYLKSL